MQRLIEYLKQQIEFKYRIMCYVKLHKQYLLNRFEKNNVHVLIEALSQLRMNRY